MHTKYLTICKYYKDTSVDIAKVLILPSLRGTWLPSFDKQEGWGWAVNWIGIRLRMSSRNFKVPNTKV